MKRTPRNILSALTLLLPLAAFGQATRTELAGNPLAQFPFFEYVRAFNENAPVNVAIDPYAFPGHRRGHLRHVRGESQDDWASSPSLADVTPGGALTHAFVAGTIQANTVEVAAASTLNADAGDRPRRSLRRGARLRPGRQSEHRRLHRWTRQRGRALHGARHHDGRVRTQSPRRSTTSTTPSPRASAFRTTS